MTSAGAPEVLLLGGSGDVGTRLARMLLAQTSARVTTLSRRPAGAGALKSDRLRHVTLNVAAQRPLEIAPDTIVVNLTEATPVAVARQVMRAGGWFLETSATPDYLGDMAQGLRDDEGPGGAILCVGAAPGLTNLMVAAILAATDTTTQIDIGVEMGTGRHYGAGGTEWFLRTAGQTYPIVIDNVPRRVAPGGLTRKFAFRPKGRPRFALGYGFAEQEFIAKRSQGRLHTVRSFVALDPPWLTRILAWMLALGLGPGINRNARKLARWMGQVPAFGPKKSRFLVEGFDPTGHLTAQIRLETGDQAEATAAMILATVQTLLGERAAMTGLSMITDHLDLDGALQTVRQILPETTISARFDPDVPARVDVSP